MSKNTADLLLLINIYIYINTIKFYLSVLQLGIPKSSHVHDADTPASQVTSNMIYTQQLSMRGPIDASFMPFSLDFGLFCGRSKNVSDDTL